MSDLFHSVWQYLGPFKTLKIALFHSFHSWVIFHCIYVLHLLYLFLCRWTFRLLPCLIYISLYSRMCLIKHTVLLLMYSVFSSALHVPFSLKKKKKEADWGRNKRTKEEGREGLRKEGKWREEGKERGREKEREMGRRKESSGQV